PYRWKYLILLAPELGDGVAEVGQAVVGGAHDLVAAVQDLHLAAVVVDAVDRAHGLDHVAGGLVVAGELAVPVGVLGEVVGAVAAAEDGGHLAAHLGEEHLGRAHAVDAGG